MRSVEDLQVRIMRELVSPGSFRWDIRESFAMMAEKLRVDEETVRRGINRAQEIGFLRSIHLILNPNLLGFEAAGIQLDIDDPERKPSAISHLGQVEGIVTIINLIGKLLRATYYYPDEQAYTRTAQRIRDVCSSKTFGVWKGEFPPCSLKLHPTDWQIIKALRKNPRRQVSEVAADVRVSTKTVRRRLTTMTQEKAFYLLPELNYDKYPGVASSILVNVPDQGRKNLIDKQIVSRLDRLVFSRTDAKVFSMFTVLCVNMSEADDIYRWIRGLDGIQDARMDFIREIILPGEWLDKEIAEHLSDTTKRFRSGLAS